MKNFFKDWKKVLFVVFILGAFARMYNLGGNSFVADEFLDINASYGYFKTGEWQSWDFNNERPDTIENSNEARDERAFAYKWQVAQLFKVAPPTEAVARSVSMVWGLVTLLLMYRMTSYFTKQRNIGLIAAFLYAVSISALIMDRRLRMYAMFVPTFLFFSWMIFRSLEEKYSGNSTWMKQIWNKYGINVVFVVPALVSGALSLHLHLLTLNIAFIVVVYCIVRMFQMAKRDTFTVNKYTVLTGAFFLSLVGSKLFAPQAYSLFVSSFSFPDNHYGYFELVLKDYAHALIAIMVMLCGAYYAIKHLSSKKAGLWLTLSFFVPLFMAVFMWRRNVGEQYISFAQPFKIMLIAIGIYAIALFFQRHLEVYKKQAFAITIALSLILLPHYGYMFENDTVYRQTSESDNAQYKKIFAYFMKNRAPEDILITRDLRSYYVSGAHVHIENIGGEITKDKLTSERLSAIIQQYPSGWIILSDNDDTFVAHDAEIYMAKNMERISNPSVRGKVKVFRYGAHAQ